MRRRRASCGGSPRPTGPVSRMLFANSGSRAIAPPKSTANRSRLMAPNSTGVRRTKRAPANSASRLGAASSSRSSVRSLTAEDAAEGHAEQRRRHDVDELGPHGKEQPADSRPDDRRALECDSPQGQCAREQVRRDERGRHGAGCRPAEGGRGTGGECEQEERPQRIRSRERDQEQAAGDEALEDDGCRIHASAWQPVGDVTSGQAPAAVAAGTPPGRSGRGRADSRGWHRPASRSPPPSSAPQSRSRGWRPRTARSPVAGVARAAVRAIPCAASRGRLAWGRSMDVRGSGAVARSLGAVPR